VTELPTTNGFDYTALPADVTKSLRGTAAAIRLILSRAIIDVGNHLIAAKRLLRHGDFSRWAEAELGMTVRTAERYMRAARFLEAKPTCMSALPANIIYRLSAPSAPVDVVQDVVFAAEAGTPLSAEMIQDRLRGACSAEHHGTPVGAEHSVPRETPAARRRAKTACSGGWNPYQEKEQEDPELRLKLLVDRAANALGDDAWAVLNALQDHASTFESLLRQRLASESSPTTEVAVGSERRRRRSAA